MISKAWSSQSLGNGRRYCKRAQEGAGAALCAVSATRMNANDDLRRHEPVQAALGAAGPGRSTAGIRALMHGRRLKGPAGACSSLFRSLEVSGEDQGPSRCRRHVAARAAWHGAGAGRRLAGLGAGGWPAHRCSLRWSGKRSLQRGASPGGPQGALPAGCGASWGTQGGEGLAHLTNMRLIPVCRRSWWTAAATCWAAWPARWPSSCSAASTW